MVFKDNHLLKYAASIEGAELNMPAPNYRPTENIERSCASCSLRDQEGRCNAYNFQCKQEFVCDTWQPQSFV
jgi:hypothetical protein